MIVFSIRPAFTLLLFTLSIVLAVIFLSPPISRISEHSSSSLGRLDIWSVKRFFEWRPCKWWLEGHLTALPVKSNGYIRVDCYGGLNQMRRDFCDGVGIARLLNATLVLPRFKVAAYWNESSGFADVFDVDYFIQQMNGFVNVVKELPAEIASKEPLRINTSKRKGHFDYIESVLPYLLKHRYISFTPAISQRRDRYPLYAKAALCQACYNALRLTSMIERKASKLLQAMPKPFLSLHLRFEPDMVAYSQCEYQGLSPASVDAIEAARVDRQPWTGEAARIWRNRGKCPLTPNETAFILQTLGIPTNTNIYLAAGDGIMAIEGLTSIYTNVVTKSNFLSHEDISSMHGNTKAALDYYISINSDSYMATYFGNMDKMVAAMRTINGLYKTLFLSRRAFAHFTSQGLNGTQLMEALWKAHRDDFAKGIGLGLPDCLCEFKFCGFIDHRSNPDLRDIGTARAYKPPYIPTKCNGNRPEQFPPGNLFVAVSGALWDDGAACGRRYRLRCLSGAKRPCKVGNVDVRVVDYCSKTPCPSTIFMSVDAFAAISQHPQAIINVEFIEI